MTVEEGTSKSTAYLEDFGEALTATQCVAQSSRNVLRQRYGLGASMEGDEKVWKLEVGVCRLQIYCGIHVLGTRSAKLSIRRETQVRPVYRYPVSSNAGMRQIKILHEGHKGASACSSLLVSSDFSASPSEASQNPPAIQ